MPHPRLKLPSTLLAACLLLPGAASAQSAPPLPCGNTVMVARGDTLSRIAERCDVSEAVLLRANPGISGSDDLRAGLELRLWRDDPDLSARFDRAVGSVGAFASRAGNALNDLAGEAGTSVDDLLTRNPDLHSRLRHLGDRLGLADASAASASIAPASGPSGTLVTISALGLPADMPVVVGAGARRSAYEVLDRARTSGTGTVLATVPVPAWAAGAGPLVFVVASPERGLAVRSKPFEVAGPAKP